MPANQPATTAAVRCPSLLSCLRHAVARPRMTLDDRTKFADMECGAWEVFAGVLFGRSPTAEARHSTKTAVQFELPRIFERVHPECLKMMTDNHELDSQPCKRPCLEIETFSSTSLKDCVGSQNVSPSFPSLTVATKRTRSDGSISVCDKQPRVQEILENSNRDAVHSFYYEINQYLGELHFQRQVRELRNRLAAQQSPSKLSA
jgi:hypothetical protein